MTLPEPDPAFHWIGAPWGHVLRCRPMASAAEHLFTTRQLPLRAGSQGTTTPASEHVADVHLPAADAWQLAASVLGAGLADIRRVKQVHGRSVRVLRRGHTSRDDAGCRPEADALVSDEPGLVLAVQVADCVPIILVDRRLGVAAAVHAGWRGTQAGIAGAAVRTMSDVFATRPEDLLAAVGPSIGPCCYDVGPDVVDAFARGGHAPSRTARWFAKTAAGGWRLDLWAATVDQLRDAGVPEAQLFQARLCTRTHADVFASFRADGARAGRMAALVRVPAAAGG